MTQNYFSVQQVTENRKKKKRKNEWKMKKKICFRRKSMSNWKSSRHAIRLENKVSNDTKLLFCTTGKRVQKKNKNEQRKREQKRGKRNETKIKEK